MYAKSQNCINDSTIFFYPYEDLFQLTSLKYVKDIWIVFLKDLY